MGRIFKVIFIRDSCLFWEFASKASELLQPFYINIILVLIQFVSFLLSTSTWNEYTIDKNTPQ